MLIITTPSKFYAIKTTLQRIYYVIKNKTKKLEEVEISPEIVVM